MRFPITVHLCVLFCHVFLQSVSTDDIPCSVTQDDGETLYIVPDFTAKDCNFHWTNSTGSVLANQRDEKDMIVEAKNITTLRTSQCLMKIHYQRDCISEGTPRTATCISNCTRNAGTHEGPVTGVLVYVIVAIAVVILVLLLLCFLCIIYKLCHRDPADSCNQTTCVYSHVKTSNHPPNTTDEETAT